jgi:hypothetical protein
MSGSGAFKVFVAIHAVDYASRHLLHFADLADKAAKGVAGINKQLALMGSLAATMAGAAGVGFMVNLAKESTNAYMKVAQLRLEMQNLGLTASQISGANNAAYGISQLHPALNLASSTHLFKDTYSVLGHYNESIAAMPFMSKFQLAMRGAYGERGDEMSYDAVRAAELQMGKNFNLKGLQTYLDVYTKVVNATGGKVDPQQIHGFMKNSVYGRMSQTPDALAKQIMLMMEMGGSRAGTAFNAIDRFAIAHIAQNGVSKEKLEKWVQYGLLQDIKRNDKGKIIDFSLTQQGLYQKDKVEWLYSVFAPALKKHGIDAMDPSGIPKVAQMFSTQTGAGGAITTLLQAIRNQKEVGMYQQAAGVEESAKRYERSPMGAFGGLSGAWQTFLMTLGQQLAPTFVAAAQGMTQLIQGMTAWIKQHPNMTKALFGLGVAVFAVIGAIGLITTLIVALPADIALAATVITASLIGVFAHIVGLVVLYGDKIKNAFKGFLLGIVWLVNGIVQGVSGAMANFPALRGAADGLAANSTAWATGVEKSMGFGGNNKPVTVPKGGGHHVSQKVDIHINGANATPKELAWAMRDVLRDVVTPKSGYGFSASTHGMHGFAAT